MVDVLVETKLLLPRVRRELVARPRLDEIVDSASDAALMLVSAPAGFGKTTLLASVLSARSGEGGDGWPVAWVSLDERDADANRFWSYVLRALEDISAGAAAGALTLLESGGASLEAVVASLINELSVRSGNLTLVLDDYHLADSADISASVGFLLDHRPPQLKLILSTRADPALPLARLRARGELVEVRADDLRFTGDETLTYLNIVQGLALSDADVAVLETRTEGWVAALQLAALSLRGHGDDTAEFIAGFAGDDKFVVDFLVDEVLDQQPPALRRFLLDTSILERLTGTLCDAVTGADDGGAVLESLERRNLLLIPLDTQRRWYRYHHLFADVLQSRLLAERPADVGTLHRRASDWFQQAGDVEAAVRHAFAAGEVDLAADLIEMSAADLRRERREAVIRRWIADVPPPVVRQRPVLALSFIAALMASNQFDGVGERLDELDEALAGPDENLVVGDASEWARLPARASTQRAGLALVSGDLAGTLTHAAAALDYATSDDQLTVAAAAALQGLASWSQGDLNAALQSYSAAAAGLEATGHVADVFGCTVTLVDLNVALGRSREAHRTLVRALALAESQGAGGVVRGTADLWVAMSRVAWGRGQLTASAQYLDRAAVLGEACGLPQQPHRWRVNMAALRAAQGDFRAADGLLEEAERLYTGDFSPNVRPVAATRARLHLRSGDLVAAQTWVRFAGVGTDDTLSYLREYEHITLTRVLLAEHSATADLTRLVDAMSLLERLEVAAQAGARNASLIEITVLRALAAEASDDRQQALRIVQRAVELAAPDQWVEALVDGGPPLRQLLGLLPPSSALSEMLTTIDTAATTYNATRPSHDSPLSVTLTSTPGLASSSDSRIYLGRNRTNDPRRPTEHQRGTRQRRRGRRLPLA